MDQGLNQLARWCAVTLIAGGALAGGEALAAKGATKVAVLGLKATSAEHAPLARTLTAALTQGLGRDGGLEVIAASDLKAMLDLKAQQAILGCEDDKCVFELASALAVDQLVTGEVGQVGEQTIVFATLLDLKGQRALARTSTTLGKGGDPVASMKQLAISLTQPDAPGADVPLQSLRIVLLVDEYEEDGRPIVRRPLETCISKHLRDQEAAVLNTAVVRNLTGKTGAREILAGGLPDGISPTDVDAVFIAAADYVEQASSSRIKKGVTYRVDAAFQLVLVASGEIIASDEVTGVGKGYRPKAVTKKLAARACQQVTPALNAALTKRVDRGRRVQISLEGLVDAGAADNWVASLKKTSGVGRVRLISYADGKAAIDVWVVRGDGNRLAMTLQEQGKLSVERRSGDRLTLKPRG
jgi:TolB-like protein